MKKMLINLMIGISVITMVGCTSNEIKSHIENDTTVVEENNVIDDFILEQRSEDMEILVNYINGNI